jgi:hypothetical protein
MTAMFRAVRAIITFPTRLVFGDGEDYFVTYDRAPRRPLIMRWRRGEDGKLEGHWDCED